MSSSFFCIVRCCDVRFAFVYKELLTIELYLIWKNISSNNRMWQCHFRSHIYTYGQRREKVYQHMTPFVSLKTSPSYNLQCSVYSLSLTKLRWYHDNHTITHKILGKLNNQRPWISFLTTYYNLPSRNKTVWSIWRITSFNQAYVFVCETI